MKVKVFAIAAALMMMAVVGVAIVDHSDDSDATAVGSFTVYLSTDGGSTWSPSVVNANDGAQALKASSWWSSGDSIQDLDTTPQSSYATMNDNYGAITKFYGQTNHINNDVWNVFVYVNNTWIIANNALGFYKCFDDYAAAWQTANIALYYGAEAITVPSTLTSNMTSMSSITSVSENDNFLNTFYIKFKYTPVDSSYPVLTPTVSGEVIDINENYVDSAAISTGVTIQGYGSDAYLALIDAVNYDEVNFTGIGSVPMSGYYWYGWMTSLFGLQTTLVNPGDSESWEDDEYAYWIVYEDFNPLTSQGTVSHYNLGFLGVAGSAVADSTISLVFDIASM